jgi:hypothetical protein
MNQFMVVQPNWVDEQLAHLWLNAEDRPAITSASNDVYRELKHDADVKGELVQDNLRKIVLGPLCVYFTVHADDCTVRVWSIRPAKNELVD